MYLAIDIGGTAIKYGLVTVDGTITEQDEMPTEAKEHGGPGIVDKVRKLVQKYQSQIKGVAMSTGGMVDDEAGVIVYALEEAIPNYTGTNWKKIIGTEFNLPLEVENDVNCAAMGEYWQGSGKNAKSLFALTVGTSIGGALLLDGKIWHGASNSAGEVAYMQIPSGRMHDYVSTTRLVEDVRSQKNLAKGSINGKAVFEFIAKGDDISQKALETLCENLADGITNIVSVVNPELIVLGGGIMVQEAVIRPILEAKLQARLVERVYQSTKIAFASCGNNAGMLGALYNFLQKQA